jgi:hypothetical protein
MFGDFPGNFARTFAVAGALNSGGQVDEIDRAASTGSARPTPRTSPPRPDLTTGDTR